MDNPSDRLRRQLDDDETIARHAFGEHNDATPEWQEILSGCLSTGGQDLDDLVTTGDSAISRHMARWDPARVLADVAAKRRILGAYGAAQNDAAAARHDDPALSDRDNAWFYGQRVGERNALDHVVEVLATVLLDPSSRQPSTVERGTVSCDEGCGAYLEPHSLIEYDAALRHWREHDADGGCSHGR